MGNMFPRDMLNGLWSSGVRVAELGSVEELFDLAGQDAIAFKYAGGLVDFWIEIEAHGEKRQSRYSYANLQLDPDHTVEGYFLWVRGITDQTGTETWTLAMSEDLVSTQTARVQIAICSILTQGRVAAERPVEDPRWKHAFEPKCSRLVRQRLRPVG